MQIFIANQFTTFLAGSRNLIKSSHHRPSAKMASMTNSNSTLDEALEALSGAAANFANGNTNHAPMVVETLTVLGHDQAILPWIDNYRPMLGDRPSSRPALQGDWREALGKRDLWPEWVALFQAELAERPWPEVLNLWIEHLAPGFSGEATHGIIRTAHAVRALGARETKPRLNELADALAYWAATFHDFKMVAPSSYRFGIKQALAQVPPLEVSRAGNITETLGRVDMLPPFAPVTNLYQGGAKPLDDLSVLTEHFAGLYLANAHDPGRVFALLHALTGPSALRLLAPHISQANTELLMRFAWQTAAAVQGIWSRDKATQIEDGAETDAAEDLIDAAVNSGAAHAIKFTEACLREHALNPQPVYLAAAKDAIGRLDG